MKTHNFTESLQKSSEQADAPWWREVYEQAFPNLAQMICLRSDGWAQRGGIDRLLVLEDGTTLKVDEKVRSTVYEDFCLEYWSDRKRRIPGWVAKDLTCDFIAYAFVPNRTCYLLPFQILRRAWRTHGREWVASYKKIEALNEGYVTVSVAVPIGVVLSALSEALIIRWSSHEDGRPPAEPISDEELQPDFWQSRFEEADFE